MSGMEIATKVLRPVHCQKLTLYKLWLRFSYLWYRCAIVLYQRESIPSSLCYEMHGGRISVAKFGQSRSVRGVLGATLTWVSTS